MIDIWGMLERSIAMAYYLADRMFLRLGSWTFGQPHLLIRKLNYIFHGASILEKTTAFSHALSLERSPLLTLWVTVTS